ncbi:MAG: hypothetical protein HZT41_06265 [Dechloromonas sp.]|nr:MAG: hypothetical protein HZT41_06265 [Dechloromonas sp.]
MTSELPQQPLTPEELALRRKKVRKAVLLRAFLLGLMVAAWWIFFAPDSLVDPALKNPMGVAAGMIAMGAYLYFLREALFPRK